MKRSIKKMLNVLIPMSVIYLLVCLGLFLGQRTMIYHPVAAGSNEYPRLSIDSDGVALQVSAHRLQSPRAVVYFGGNAEDVSTTMPDLSNVFVDCDIFAMHYRGYGGSGGSPSESALNNDAQALLDLVMNDHKEVVVVGRSLGSGIATHLASRNAVGHLILITPYDSLVNVAAAKFPFVPVHWLMRDKYESWKLAADVTAPVMVLAAAQDEIIPLSSTQRLVDAFDQGQCQFRIIDPATHNSLELPKGDVETFIGT